MPDDSSDDFKAAQSKHADMIRTSRVFSQATGVPLERLRVAMRNAADATAAQAAAPVVDTTPLPLAPYPDPPPSRFDAPGFSTLPDASQVPPNSNLPASGTAVTPYVMGTNRSAPFPTPADDTWDIATGPSDSTGGPYDGVIDDDGFDIWQGTGGGDTTTMVASKDGGGTITISSTNVYYYRRRKTYDTIGRLIHIGPQELINSIPQGSIVTLT